MAVLWIVNKTPKKPSADESGSDLRYMEERLELQRMTVEAHQKECDTLTEIINVLKTVRSRKTAEDAVLMVRSLDAGLRLLRTKMDGLYKAVREKHWRRFDERIFEDLQLTERTVDLMELTRALYAERNGELFRVWGLADSTWCKEWFDLLDLYEFPTKTPNK